ncbi:YtxH domain-containing protein [Gilvibacter sediminis]|uniref:YtxH domain-containing protein n=1 Tax=Gilvibacter sediminis TaxID=379071 RepID=UPI002350BFA4|nr:YtxH domain-containing protein [Gilvibacter sediminis]MDC7999366.1 YtxH domain-containing protein [Gilvibacter sediminis]
MSTQNTVLGILGGIAVGAIAGVLLAPEKGATTRAKIADKAKDLKDNLNNNVDTTVDRVSEKLDVLKEAGSNIIESSKSELARAQQNL